MAIAKNEGRYIAEWLAYHLSIGVDHIIVYDNESRDHSSLILDTLSVEFPVERVAWPSVLRASPQRSAYNDALARVAGYGWVGFIDIDEFIVPWGFDDLRAFIRAVPSEAASVAVNWRTFGSSGITGCDYSSVLKTFAQCAHQSWANNKHVKTIARPSCISEVHIHDVRVSHGLKLRSDFASVQFESEGKTQEVIYGGIQVNHYQTKTLSEFTERMARGNANFPLGHPSHRRDSRPERFSFLDRNEETDCRIEKFIPQFEETLSRVRATLGGSSRDTDRHGVPSRA